MELIKPLLAGTPAGVVRSGIAFNGQELNDYVTTVLGRLASSVSISERVRFDQVHDVLKRRNAVLVQCGNCHFSEASHGAIARIYDDHLKYVIEKNMSTAVREEAEHDKTHHGLRVAYGHLRILLFATADKELWIQLTDPVRKQPSGAITYHMYIAGDMCALQKYEKLIEELAQCQLPDLAMPSLAKKRMEYLYLFNGELCTTSLELTFSDESLETHYEDNVVAQANELIDTLTNKDKGIGILHGVPGSGKSSLLKHIVSRVEKTFLFLSVETAKILGDPSFGRMLLGHTGSVIIIEDAETVLAKRGKGKNSSVASILNLTDGLLSDALAIQVLCTFNCDIDEIDSALLRPGRLIQNIEINALGPTKADALRKKLGRQELNCAGTLAEIYAQEIIEKKETATVEAGAVVASV